MNELLVGLLAREREGLRTQELLTTLLGEVSEDNSDDEDDVKEM